MENADLLVLGLGNVICSDDGLGVSAVHRLLGAWEPPPGVRVLDGGTLGLALLPYLEDSGSVILVDAIQADAPPGTLVRLDGDDVGPAVAGRLSVHQIGVADLLDCARLLGRTPPSLVLLGLVPRSLELGIALSPDVEARVPDLIESVLQEASDQGYAFTPKGIHEMAGAGPPRLGPLPLL